MADNIYLNVSIQNPGTGNVLDDYLAAKFNVSYDLPIIDNPSDYYMSIVKFEIPLQSLPLFIMDILPNQVNSNLSPFQVGVCHNEDPATLPNPPLTTEFRQSVIWETQNWGEVPPIQNQPFQVVTSYYDCYSYSHMLYLVNKALRAAYAAAVAANPLLSPGDSPYFEYDADTKLINCIQPYDFINNLSAPFGWKVFINDNLSYYFQSFDYEINHKRFEIATHSFNSNNSYIAPFPYPQSATPPFPPSIFYPRGPGTTYISKSEYPCNDYINSVRKLVFTTNSMPIRKEYFPAANVSQTGSVSQLGVITDFNLDLDNVAGAQRGVALYDAQLYRMIDMFSEVPMRVVDIQVFWADRVNNLYPIFIGNYDTINIKLGFFKKSKYNSDGSLK